MPPLCPSDPHISEHHITVTHPHITGGFTVSSQPNGTALCLSRCWFNPDDHLFSEDGGDDDDAGDDDADDIYDDDDNLSR